MVAGVFIYNILGALFGTTVFSEAWTDNVVFNVPV